MTNQKEKNTTTTTTAQQKLKKKDTEKFKMLPIMNYPQMGD